MKGAICPHYGLRHYGATTGLFYFLKAQFAETGLCDDLPKESSLSFSLKKLLELICLRALSPLSEPFVAQIQAPSFAATAAIHLQELATSEMQCFLSGGDM